MSQVTSKLRRSTQGYLHWCRACEGMHLLLTSWSFNGDLERPSFTPSFRHSFLQTVKANGEWTGEWVRDAEGKMVPGVCHYILTDGVLNYCSDCTHALAGKAVPLPPLPEEYTDKQGV